MVFSLAPVTWLVLKERPDVGNEGRVGGLSWPLGTATASFFD